MVGRTLHKTHGLATLSDEIVFILRKSYLLFRFKTEREKQWVSITKHIATINYLSH